MVDFRKIDYVVHVIYVNNEKERAKDRSLGNTASDRKVIGISATKTNKLFSLWKVGFKLSVSNIANAIVFQFFQKKILINGVEFFF